MSYTLAGGINLANLAEKDVRKVAEERQNLRARGVKTLLGNAFTAAAKCTHIEDGCIFDRPVGSSSCDICSIVMDLVCSPSSADRLSVRLMGYKYVKAALCYIKYKRTR